MAEKKTKLSIVIRAVDQATAKVNAINAKLDAITKPFRDFKEALSDLREKSGLDEVAEGFSGVGTAIAGVLSKVAMVGGAIAAAVLGVKALIDEFAELGNAAERMGLPVDTLAQLRYAADRAGVDVGKLDTGMLNLSKNMGELRAGGGGMLTFLKQVSPALAKQIKATKSNEEAFALLADAMAKIKDPAKRAIFAQKTLGDASLAPLLARGAKGVQELRDRYAELAGPQAGAAAAAGEFGDSMADLKATLAGVKAALVEGLAPALKVVVEQLREWFAENRKRIAEFAASLGKKLPSAVKSLVGVFRGIVNAVRPFVDSTTKLKIIAVALAATIVGPLISSIYALGVAIMTTPVGWIVGGIAAIAAGAYMLIKHWDSVKAFFSALWDGVKSVFGAFFSWVADVFLTYTPLGIIIDNWGPISDFFAKLWDGITAVFRKAWEIIKGIVDKVVGAVQKVVGAAKKIGRLLTDGGPGDIARQMIEQQRAGGGVAEQAQRVVSGSSSTAAKVTVDFANAPRGTRVQTDPQSTADVDLSVGYQMIPGMP